MITDQRNALNAVQKELQNGVKLSKCKKCGCMKDILENLNLILPKIKSKKAKELETLVIHWQKQLEQTKYSCLGCEHCYPAVVTNIINQALPENAQALTSTCSFEVRDQTWPPVPGEYFAVRDSPNCSVAVSTLASDGLAETLANMKPKGLCIVGKTETENIGIDKIVKNTITNPSIRFLIVAGKDPEGHQSGKTLLALVQNGVDENIRVIGSPAINPILKNVTMEEIETFRKQVQVIDMLGCEKPSEIIKQITHLSNSVKKSCSCKECNESTRSIHVTTAPVIQATKKAKLAPDKSGYFVIIPQSPNKIIAEHYSYDNTLLRIIEGTDAQSVYSAIVEGGWVSQLSHAAYLGKELAKAELSLELGFRYVQDTAQYHRKKRNRRMVK